MNVGEKIRKLRSDRNLTQPELAQAIGIEQSYLSKLENERSVPSAEIFDAVLAALDVDVSTFLEGVDDAIVRAQLRHIPQVAVHLSRCDGRKVRYKLRWLTAAAAAAALGITALAIGYFGWAFPSVRYDYQSQGVIREGEPTNLFAIFNMLLVQRQSAGEITSSERLKLSNEYWHRIDQRDWVLEDYRGENFVVAVPGGVRSYSLQKTIATTPFANRILMMLGAFFGVSGIIALFLESRFVAAWTARLQLSDSLLLAHDDKQAPKGKQRVPA
jgi:transcriptional regulator with XRE-family HTH domain